MCLLLRSPSCAADSSVFWHQLSWHQLGQQSCADRPGLFALPALMCSTVQIKMDVQLCCCATCCMQPAAQLTAVCAAQFTPEYLNTDSPMNQTTGVCTVPAVNASMLTTISNSAEGQVRVP